MVQATLNRRIQKIFDLTLRDIIQDYERVSEKGLDGYREDYLVRLVIEYNEERPHVLKALVNSSPGLLLSCLPQPMANSGYRAVYATGGGVVYKKLVPPVEKVSQL